MSVRIVLRLSGGGSLYERHILTPMARASSRTSLYPDGILNGNSSSIVLRAVKFSFTLISVCPMVENFTEDGILSFSVYSYSAINPSFSSGDISICRAILNVRLSTKTYLPKPLDASLDENIYEPSADSAEKLPSDNANRGRAHIRSSTVSYLAMRSIRDMS